MHKLPQTLDLFQANKTRYGIRWISSVMTHIQNARRTRVEIAAAQRTYAPKEADTTLFFNRRHVSHLQKSSHRVLLLVPGTHQLQHQQQSSASNHLHHVPKETKLVRKRLPHDPIKRPNQDDLTPLPHPQRHTLQTMPKMPPQQ